jgi:hypothetical protein
MFNKKSPNLSFIFIFTFLVSTGLSQPIPTNEWVNYLSTSSTFNDMPVSVGSVIDAYDPDEVLCGTFTVTAEGQYGFLLVYKDDSMTSGIDEGAEVGDTITFYIDGHLAIGSGPDDPVWTSNGDVIQTDIAGYSNYAPVIAGFPTSVEFRAEISVTIDLNEYVSDLDNLDLTLDWTVSGAESVVVDIDTETNIAEISAPQDYEGVESITFEVADDSLATDSAILEVSVIPYILTRSIPMNADWNLLSWDVDTENDSLEVLLSDILPDVSVVLGFEEGGLTYDPAWPQFSSLQLMDHFHGYWVRTEAATTLNITGATVADTIPLQLDRGWNLVSYLPDEADSIAHALTSIYDDILIVLGFDTGGLTYDPAWPQFSNLNILSPGLGYWIKLSQAATLVYPNDQVLEHLSRIPARHHANVKPTREWISIFGSTHAISGSLIQAKDPQGTICGEFIVADAGYYGMIPVYRDDPDTELDEGAEPGDEIRIFVDDVEESERVTWSEFGEVIRVDLTHQSEGLFPDYALSSNYPNPFNPVTTIRFQLPNVEKVNITIYNSLGQQVLVLQNGILPAGKHMTNWDGKDAHGKDVSSGIYLYRMQAGPYIQNQKMILLR